MNFTDIPSASHDLAWAKQNFITDHGQFPVLNSGEKISTNKPLLYRYGGAELISQIEDGYFKLAAKREITFVANAPNVVKSSDSTATYYVAIFPSTYFLHLRQPVPYFARCHDSETLYPVVAYGAM
ncbi:MULTISPECIES: hypothetical protein [Rhizobium]|uniref:Uncharacterized protein n=1 Tax=Rhizobium tumorigenes TaxID=2041385 RepID=A0AAF1KSA3_9HYPH|nr:MULTISPECIES: hypothetical protein [Rhizobium]MBO9102077.1 hypothetical protein [Rhizobium sp. L58/93]MBO9135188.1 hypothetical protein [Rhizobium sp. B209b/85]MBO9172226.1 hypothetical protein [Rhizobium sp. L245/93]MBO9187986.1 hypothetical protein [Rhizobium sp. E27B/91]QXZ87627.1 hypothetical protein J5287_28540 [Rhizobium sp. K1/93]